MLVMDSLCVNVQWVFDGFFGIWNRQRGLLVPQVATSVGIFFEKQEMQVNPFFAGFSFENAPVSVNVFHRTGGPDFGSRIHFPEIKSAMFLPADLSYQRYDCPVMNPESRSDRKNAAKDPAVKYFYEFHFGHNDLR